MNKGGELTWNILFQAFSHIYLFTYIFILF